MNALNIIAAFVWNLQLKRALTDAPGRNETQNFWRIMLGTTLDMAVIEWCKLFGSDDEDYHWKKQIPDADHDSFRSGLLASLDVTGDEWKSYWASLKNYRDQHAAHGDADFLKPPNKPTYPDLTLALKAASYYYLRLIKALNAKGVKHNYPSDLMDYCQRFHAQALQMATTAYIATKEIPEEVDR